MSHALADVSKADCTTSGPGEKTCKVTDQHRIYGENGTKVVAVLTAVRVVLVEEYWENKTKWIFSYDLTKITDNFDVRLNIDLLDKDGDLIVTNAIVIPVDRSCPRDSVTATPAPRQGIIDYDYAPAVRSIRLHEDKVIVFEGSC